MIITPIVAVKIINTDGSSLIVKEGDFLEKIVYEENGNIETLAGICRVISVSTRAYSNGPSTCPPDPFFNTIARINRLIIDISTDYDAKFKSIPIQDIISIKVRNESDIFANLELTNSITDLVNNVNEGATIVLSEGAVNESIEITKGVTLEGANSGVPQNYNQEV